MKRRIFLSIAALFAAVLALQAQQSKMPQWFMHPADGEYVGVSMPMDNAEATEVSAEMSALLAYVLCQKVDSTVQASSMSMADENVARSYSSTIGMMSYNVGYRVLRKEVAADGTVWVALKCYDDAAATLWLTMRVNWEGEEQIDNGKTDVLNCSTLKMTYSNGTNRCVLQAQTNVEIHQDSDENQFIVLLQTDRAQGSYSGSLDAAPQGVDKKALKKRETDLREVGFNFAEGISKDATVSGGFGTGYFCVLQWMLGDRWSADMEQRKQQFRNVANYQIGNVANVYYNPQTGK